MCIEEYLYMLYRHDPRRGARKSPSKTKHSRLTFPTTTKAKKGTGQIPIPSRCPSYAGGCYRQCSRPTNVEKRNKWARFALATKHLPPVRACLLLLWCFPQLTNPDVTRCCCRPSQSLVCGCPFSKPERSLLLPSIPHHYRVRFGRRKRGNPII